jgi:hypothetical protein
MFTDFLMRMTGSEKLSKLDSPLDRPNAYINAGNNSEKR